MIVNNEMINAYDGIHQSRRRWTGPWPSRA